MSHCLGYSKQLFLLQEQLYRSLGPVQVQEIILFQGRLQKKIADVLQYYQVAIGGTTRTENQLVQQAKDIHATTAKTHDDTIKVTTMDVHHKTHTTLRKDRNLMDYVKNGACVGVFAGIDALHIRAKKEMKYAQVGGDLRVGSAHVSADAKAMLFKDGKLDPSLQLKGEVGAMVASASAFAGIGNEYISANGEASVSVGVVGASATAVIRKDEITMKAGVGASAVKGQVKGTFNLFGLKITATGTGDLGSIGASAEFSSKKGEFEFGASGSLLAGLGFKIHVSY